jgi:hypothetical protein
MIDDKNIYFSDWHTIIIPFSLSYKVCLHPFSHDAYSFPFFLHTQLALVPQSSFLHLHTLVGVNLFWLAMTYVLLFFF